MNILSTVLGGIKGAAISLIIPIVSASDPVLGQGLSDAVDAFNSGKPDAGKLGLDAIAIVKEKLPKFSDACDALTNFVATDIPLIEQHIIPDVEKVVAAFEAATKA